jgi:hypothetical protein
LFERSAPGSLIPIDSATAAGDIVTKNEADVKATPCDDKNPAGRSGSACAVVTKRQQEVNGKYHKKAGGLDLEQGTAPGDAGPFQKELNEYGQKGRVIAPLLGAIAEMSPDT